MKDKAEFIEHCVLQNRMTPTDAMDLYKATHKALWDDWKPDLSAPGPFLKGLWELLYATTDGTRRTVFALLDERYNRITGERK